MCRNAPGELQRRRPTASNGGIVKTGLSWASLADVVVEPATRGRRYSRRHSADGDRSCAVAGTGTSAAAEAGEASIDDREHRGMT